MNSSPAEEQDKGNSITKRVNKILESRLENDKETLLALKELSSFFTENNIQSRRNLRSQIEKRSLDINEDFLYAFRQVKESLDAIYNDVLEMNSAVQNMTTQLNCTKAETYNLLEQTTKLQAENEKLTMQEGIAGAYLKSFQLSKAEVKALREIQVTEDFFSALERVEAIHSNCRALMQCHQASAIDIMDQMAMYQEAGLERLYRWAQAHCKSIESPAISQLLTKAMSKLQHRPVLFKYVVSEYCTQRRGVVVRVFVEALTRGGPGGVPRPIEMQAHDPHRYIADMLALLRQTLPTEKEHLTTLLKGCDTMDISEEIESALGAISEGVCAPLRVRVEHVVLSPEVPLKLLYSVTNLLHFYQQTFRQEIGEDGGLVVGLSGLRDEAGERLLSRLKEEVKRELVERMIPAPCLQPPPALQHLLTLLTDLLSVPPSDSDFPNKIVNCVIDPLLEGVSLSAARMSTTDMAVYLLNCFHTMQTTLTLYEFMDDKLERLQAQCDAQVDTLTSEQASSLVANLQLGPIYTILQEPGRGPLSHIPGMHPNSLANFIRKLENFCSMPELVVMPQIGWLTSTRDRALVQRRSTEVLLAIYGQLYTSVHDPVNLYDSPDQVMPRTPAQLAEILLDKTART